jgi:hypothetical protein
MLGWIVTMHYETLAEAYRDLEQATGRLAMMDRIAGLIARAPAACCRRWYCCARGRSRQTSPGSTSAWPSGWPRAVGARETGDLGLAGERLLPERGPAGTDGGLRVAVVFGTLHEIAAAAVAGS